MATVDVKLTTKFIEVGVNPESFYTTYGYNSFTTDTVGDCNEVQNGSTDTTLPYVYSSGTENITRCFHLDSSGTDTTYLYLDTTNNARWSKFRIGTMSGQQTFDRTSATFTDLTTEGRWSWNTTVNSFGTTAGFDCPLELLATIEDGLTSTVVPPTTITASDTTNRSFQINSGGAAANQKYRVIKVSGTTGAGVPDGGSCGTVQYTGQSASITLDQNELPAAGSTVNYKVETSINSMGNNVFEAGFWADCTGTNSTFSVTRESPTPSGSISFAGGSFATEGGSGLEFIFDNTVDGTYYYDVNRISGTVSGGEVTNPGPSSFSVTSGSGRVTVNFINDSVTEIGFQGEEFVMRYGTTSNSQDLDTLNFFLYDDDTGISYSDSTIDINGAATSHQVSVVRATGDDSTSVSAYIAVSPGTTPLSTNLGTGFSLATGTTVITVNDVPGAGSSETYYVRINNGQTFINGPTYTVTQAAVPTAPTSITFEADQNVASDTITQAVTISGGAGGNIEYSENNSTWFTYSGPTDFTFTRNSAKTIYARRNDGGALSSVSQSSKTYGYFTGDPSAVGTPAETSISANDLTGVAITITGGSANTRYRIVNTTLGTGIGNTGDGNGTVTATGDTSDLPGKGETDDYKVQYRVDTAKGGDNLWRDVVPSSTSTISRTDDIPNAFTLDTLSNQATSTEVEDSVQITGITQEAVVSRTGGTGSFAVGTSTTPGTYSTTDKTITNGQYLWVKDTTSTSNGTAKSTTIAIGTATLSGSPAVQSSTFSYTTVAAGDVTVTIVYDQESGTFLPEPLFSPVVSGQNGLSNAQAREITAGTDVVFQNSSDPGSLGVTVSGLNKFTNNTTFALNQGQSVTRTWATGQLGNSVDTVTLTGQSATDFIYFKQPAVAPDTDVTPVTPANIDWDQTTAFNVTVNNVTSGENYKITENNFTTSLGEATASGTSVTIPMTLGNSTSGYGQLGLGDTQTYEIHASRSAALGGTGSFVQTDDTFTVTRSSQVVVAPTDITFSTASTVSNSTNVTVDVVGDETEGRTLQVRLGNGTWLTAPQTYNLTRGTTYSFSARTLGFQGASVSGLRVESYQVPYLSPDSSVSVVVTTTIAANAGNQTVRVQNGNAIDVYTVTSLDGSTIYDTLTGNGNLTLTASGPDELPASGSNQSYRVRAQRPILSGGNDTPVNTSGTNNNFTITRSAPTAPTVTIDADPGTRSKSVSLGVDASGGTGSTFVVSEDNSTFVASGTAFEFTRGVNKTVYGRGVTDGTQGTSGTASRQLAFINPDTSITLALSSSSISPGATANITASFTGGTVDDEVELRTNDTNTPLASGTSVGSATFNASGDASITVSSGEQPDVQGTTAQYRAYVRTPTDHGGDNGYDATSETAGITRQSHTTPNSIQFGSVPSTASASVDITVTAGGGSYGTLQVSEDNSTWFTSPQAFVFTRGTPKTVYARRLDGSVASGVSNSSFTAGYIAPDTGVNPVSVTIGASAGGADIVINNVTSGEEYQLRNQAGTVSYQSGVASGTSVTITQTGGLPTQGNALTYQVYARRPINLGGDNNYDATGDTYTITRNAGVGGAPSTSRDHGNGKWVAMVGSSSVAYATARGTTTITEQTSGGSTSTVLTTGSNPERNEFATTAGRRYYADKPINFNRTSLGHHMVPLGLKGKEFGDYHNRYEDQTYYMYAETAVNVEVYDNVTGGITGTSTSTISVPANTVTTYVRNASNSSTWIFFASDGDMVMSKTGNGGDRHVMSPASEYMYYRRGQYIRATDNTAPTNSTGGSSVGGVTYDTGGQRVVAVGIGDGAGGDSEQGVGGQNLSNTYLWPWALRDFVFTVPNTNTIHVESFNSGAWVLERTYTFSGTTTSPVTIRRDGDSGFTTTGTNYTGNAATFNSNTLWRFRGSDVFFVAVNDNSQDEEAVFGYTETVVTAPTDITFGSDPGTLSASVNITATAANGQGGLLEVSEDQTNWFTNGTAFQFTRNSPKTIYARRNLDGHTISASSYQESNTIGYLNADATIGITPSLTTIAAAYGGTVTVAITGATAQDVYRLVTTDTNTPQASGYVVDSFTGTTASSFTIANNELPDVTNTTAGYRVEVLRPISVGGDGTTQVSAGTFNISRDADRDPENFTALAGNVGDADLSTQHYATFSGTTAGTTSPGTGFNVGTTIDNGTAISVSNGEYSLNAGSNWLSGAATINQNQVVYYRGQSSGTNGTQTTHSLTIGDTTRSFTTTTFGDTFPDNYTNLAGNNIDADFNTVYYATFSTTPPGTTSPGTAFNIGTTVSDGTSVSVNNGQYRINNGSFTSTPGQINQNDDIYFRSNATASASGQSLIASLTIGSISHSFQLKTGTLPGGSAGLAKGTDVYGITLYGPDGSTEVWGTNVRQTNIVIKEYFTLPNGSSSSFTCVDANDDTKVIVSVGAPYPSSRSEARAASENLSVSKTSTGFTVTNQDNPSDPNNTSSALAVRVIAARIS